jgi:3-hydroxyisobutyrate dehydrogenase-like beta-hydroxyacid dehydrogenase
MIKLINNTLAAVNAAALAEQLVLAQAANLDTDKLRQVVAAGSGASTMLDLKAGPMLQRDFDPLFKLEHMLKDVRHCIREADGLGVELPVAKLVESLYSQAAENGLGGRDFAAVIEVTGRTRP